MAAGSIADGSAWDEVKFGVTRLDIERKPVDRQGGCAADRVLQYTAVPLPDGNTLLTFADISDSARMERALRDRADALEAADRLKNMFLSNVSYEIRTPLTNVLGFAEGLQMGIAGPLTPSSRNMCGDIRTSSTDLKTIIDAIIDLTAIDAGAMELSLDDVDMPGRHARPWPRSCGAAIDQRDLTLEYRSRRDDVDQLHRRPKRVRADPPTCCPTPSASRSRAASCAWARGATGSDIQFWVVGFRARHRAGIPEAGLRALPVAAHSGRASRAGPRAFHRQELRRTA